MKYYRIEVYEPYDGHKEMILAHKERFDDLEFHSIIQDAIDETIIDHVNRCKDVDYCHCDYWNLFGSFAEYRFGLFLNNKGFDVITPIQSITIENRPILSDKRYKDVELPICGHKCYRDEDDRCPIVCKRIGESD